jgi:IclR family transcriptional regulator, KDG regulon repressor
MDAINKAFEILEVFLKNEDELSITDISDLTKISSSTAHRITSILVERGYIEQKRKRGKYSLSSQKLVDILGIIRRRLKIRIIALPYLNELSQIVDETVEMALRSGQIAFNLEAVNTNHILNLLPESNTFNLYSTGVGKIFLAYMSERDLQDYLSKVQLVSRTPYTITRIDDLKKELNKIKRNGIAFDNEEHELGLRMVAAPVMDWEGNVVAAIGVLGYSRRISKQRMTELAPTVKEYAAKISQALGYEAKAKIKVLET